MSLRTRAKWTLQTFIIGVFSFTKAIRHYSNLKKLRRSKLQTTKTKHHSSPVNSDQSKAGAINPSCQSDVNFQPNESLCVKSTNGQLCDVDPNNGKFDVKICVVKEC